LIKQAKRVVGGEEEIEEVEEDEKIEDIDGETIDKIEEEIEV
jgi:hypothetical protein